MKLEHERYLQAALAEARKAFAEREVPIGAVVVDAKGEIIGRGFNRTDKTGDIVQHAEMVAVKRAARKQGDWRLDGARLYVTLEPCLMCLGAVLLSRVKEVHFVLSDPTFGSLRSVLNKTAGRGAYKNLKFYHHPTLEWEVKELMRSFFERLRKK